MKRSREMMCVPGFTQVILGIRKGGWGGVQLLNLERPRSLLK